MGVEDWYGFSDYKSIPWRLITPALIEDRFLQWKRLFMGMSFPREQGGGRKKGWVLLM